MLQPGNWVEVLPAADIAATLDAGQSVDGLPFMPEMLGYCGQAFRVAMRAERVCTHPPQMPFRRLSDTVVLQGLRCDGSAHDACQLGCMLLWKEVWLRRLDGRRPSPPVPEPVQLRASRDDEPGVYFCQATELPKATVAGLPLWRADQFAGMVKARTFTPGELGRMFVRLGRRRLVRALRPETSRPQAGPPDDQLRLAPGEVVEVRSRREIMATLDDRRSLHGLAFTGDMHEQCGRRARVASRVERIIVEGSGHSRQIHDTVTLEGLTCDRYLGCARGMPFLWREAWLKRVEATVDVSPACAGSASCAGGPDAVSPLRAGLVPRAGSGRPAGLGLRPQLALKRGFDLVGATVALVVLAPVLALTAVAVLAADGRPVLFRHRRPGLHEKPFTLLKFRTMRPPRQDEVWYLTDAARVSRLGRLLRSTSLDELPELWNVVRGEMSLVGPRPLLMEYLETYTPAQRRRHDMRPGITGWAAIHGRHSTRFEDRLALDVWYVDHWSLALDARILVGTIAHLVSRSDVEATQDLTAVGPPLPGVARPAAALDEQSAPLPPDVPAGEDPEPAAGSSVVR